MTTQRKLPMLALLGFALVAAGAPASSAEGPGSVACNVPINEGPDAPPPFTVQDGGRLVTTLLADGEKECRLLRGDGSLYGRAVQDAASRPYLTEYFDAEGRIFLRINLDYGADPNEQEVGGSGGGDGCSSTANNPFPVSWQFSPIEWYWNQGSFPSSDTNLDATLQALRNGHITWETNDNGSCGVADNSSVNFTYRGTTSERASFADGLSTIDYGEVTQTGGGSSMTLAIEFNRFSTLTGKVVECDIRFDNDYPWTNSPGSQPNQYDVESVAAHEVGHCALFDHVTGAGQTMLQGTEAGTTWKRTLGKGDAMGNNAKW